MIFIQPNPKLTMKRIPQPQLNFSFSPHDIIGKGFTSQVFRGRSNTTGLPVAIKIIDVNLLKEHDRKLVIT